MTLPPKLQETIDQKAKAHVWPNTYKKGAHDLYSILEPVLREVEEALDFYADRNNWMKSWLFNGYPSKWADKLKKEDCALLNCGGGRARKVRNRLRETIGPIQKQGE